ncbi:hypothetical protein [Streptococcus sp. DD12]|uniref:hypothetical protein n=1 Tax=Streptococcus sp. DD12 TaxID=1777880 RepID=UPI00079CA0AC|nr:hypothetical protein [Streptococcus sp. DD12]KXT75899.1 hypothetical protein STRDD12_01011 [Streptococcus sp. DD12]
MALVASRSADDLSKASLYLEKLSVAGTTIAAAISAGATQLLPEVTYDEDKYKREWKALKDSGTLEEMREKLVNMGHLNSLFEAAMIAGIGVYADSHNESVVTKMEKLTKEKGGGYSWEAATYQTWDNRERKRERVNDYYTDSKVENDFNQSSEKYRQLEKKKREVLDNLAKDALVSATNIVVPGFSSVASLASSIFESGKLSSVVSSGNDLSATVIGEQYSKVLSGGAKATSRLASYFETLGDIDDEKMGLSNQAKGDLFGVGGSSVIVDDTTTSSQSNIAFDLSASLQSYDFQENGVRGYILRQYDGEILKKFDDGIKRSAMSQDMRDILTGDSDKPITEIEPDVIRDALNKVNRVACDLNTNDGLRWVTRYYDNNYRDFDGLTGNAKTSHVEGSAE